MTGHDSHEYSFDEALDTVSCSESTLRRKLNENDSKLGTTKLKKGWRIPVETLEAMDIIETVTIQSTEQEITRLRIENATLRAENTGLRQLLSEREKVVALLEQSPRHKPSWRRCLYQKKGETTVE